MTPPHVRRLGALVVIAAVLAQLGLFVPSATADPVADKQAEAARIQTRLDQQNQQASALDERYNQAQLAVARAEAARTKAEAGTRDADTRLQAARAAVRGFAVDAYVHGGSAPLLGRLAGSDGRDLAVRSQYIDATSERSRKAIDDLSAARQDLGARRDELARAVKAARQQADQAAADRAALQKLIASQQALLAGLDADVTRLMAERESARQAEAARRAAADLAARQEADARAQAAAAHEPAPQPSRGAPTGRATTTTTAPPSRPTSAPPTSKGASAAIAEARRQLGKPYEYGGAGPDTFDCSGLTMWSWRAGGVSLSHSTYAQWDQTTHIPISQMQPGDLIFYGSDLHHVTMYTGGGMMIEAPHTGANVREVAVRYDGIQGIGRVG